MNKMCFYYYFIYLSGKSLMEILFFKRDQYSQNEEQNKQIFWNITLILNKKKKIQTDTGVVL